MVERYWQEGTKYVDTSLFHRPFAHQK